MDELTELFNIEVNEFQKKAKVSWHFYDALTSIGDLIGFWRVISRYLKVTNQVLCYV